MKKTNEKLEALQLKSRSVLDYQETILTGTKGVESVTV